MSDTPSTMRVLIAPPFKLMEVRDLKDSFHELQEIVGSGFEIVVPMELRTHPRIRMIVNENFIYLGLPFNLFASYLYGYGSHPDPILGTAVFACEGMVNGEPDLVGLSDDELFYLKSLYSRLFH